MTDKNLDDFPEMIAPGAFDGILPAEVPVNWQPGLTIHKATTYVEIPHELLIDSGGHTCDATCLALYGNAYLRAPAPLPWSTRIRYALRRARRRLARLGGLRLVHKDRIDQDRDD